MKAMFIAFAAMTIITVAAWWGLDLLGWSAEAQGSGSAVRLD